MPTLAEVANTFDPRTLSCEDLDSDMWGFMKTRTEPVSARQYLKFAEQDLSDGDSSRNLINAITNAKRALHLRMEDTCFGFGFEHFGGPKSFPRMVDYVSNLGITAPRLLLKLNRLRNEVEHDYVLPNRDEVEMFLDTAALFIASTERWVSRQPVELRGGQEVRFGGDAITLESLTFDWPKGIASLSFYGTDWHFNGPRAKVEFKCPSEEFFICGRFAIDMENEE